MTHFDVGIRIMDDMGLFHATIAIENLRQPGRKQTLSGVLVDTGSEYTWIPRTVLELIGVAPQRWQGFMLANGRRVDREIGFALVHAGGTSAPEIVVFAEASDFVLLGAHALEGLNLRVDPVRKEFVSAGPVIAARAA